MEDAHGEERKIGINRPSEGSSERCLRPAQESRPRGLLLGATRTFEPTDGEPEMELDQHDNYIPLDSDWSNDTVHLVRAIPAYKEVGNSVKKTFKIWADVKATTIHGGAIGEEQCVFQKDSLRNQEEHLTMLLVNLIERIRPESPNPAPAADHDSDGENDELLHLGLDGVAIKRLYKSTFQVYESWADNMRITPPGKRHVDDNVIVDEGRDATQSKSQMLRRIALWWLVWGEASTLRFMPECLCFVYFSVCDSITRRDKSSAATIGGAMYHVACNKPGSKL